MDETETPISDDAVRAAAASGDASETAVRDAVAELQAYAADSPGIESVDDLVYEWRNAFFEDPLVERTPEAYYLAVPERVWRDFAERLGWSADERAAVERAHERAVAAACDAFDDASDGAALVLGR